MLAKGVCKGLGELDTPLSSRERLCHILFVQPVAAGKK